MNRFHLATVFFAALVVTLALTCVVDRASAQRQSTAFKTAQMSGFGGYANANADIGPFRDSGVAFGVDYTRFFHFPVAPSLEARANILSGTAVNEKSYLIGVRAEAFTLGRFHPYVDYLAGLGTVHFNQSFYGPGFSRGDRSTVFNYGGGIDYGVARDWRIKADVQRQQWRPGLVKYYPTPFLFGVSYTIPFKRFNS